MELVYEFKTASRAQLAADCLLDLELVYDDDRLSVVQEKIKIVSLDGISGARHRKISAVCEAFKSTEGNVLNRLGVSLRRLGGSAYEKDRVLIRMGQADIALVHVDDLEFAADVRDAICQNGVEVSINLMRA